MTDIDRLRDFMATEVMGWTDFGDFYGIPCYPEPPKIIYTKEDTSFGPGWKPDLDSNQLDLLVGKMVGDGFEFRFYQPVGKNFACSAFIDDHEIIHPDRRLAVLLAIKAAKESK